MYTVCPKCNATFRVGAQHLQVAGGSVRCGKCDHTFNALLYLSEEPPATGDPIPASIKIDSSANEPTVAPDPAETENAAPAPTAADKPPEELKTKEAAGDIADEISDEEASSTATGFAARIRRFLEASNKNPDLKEDDTWSGEDQEISSESPEQDKTQQEEPEAEDSILAVDEHDDSDSAPESPPILTLVEGTAAEDAADEELSADDGPEVVEYEPEEIEIGSEPPEPVLNDALDTDLEAVEVVEDVDEFEAAVLATITESELGDAEDEETPEAAMETPGDDTEKAAQANLQDLAESVMDSMPDVVVEGEAAGMKGKTDQAGDAEKYASTADRIRTLEMLSDKEAETYFGEMLVDPDALEGAALGVDDDSETDESETDESDTEIEMAEDESADIQDADEYEDEAPDDDQEVEPYKEPEETLDDVVADQESTSDDEDEDSDDPEWRLVADRDNAGDNDDDDEDLEDATGDDEDHIALSEAIDDEKADDEDKGDEDSGEEELVAAAEESAGATADEDSPEPVLFIDADGEEEEKEAEPSKQESLEFNLPMDQLDSVFTEAESSPLASADSIDDEASDENGDAEDVAVEASAEIANVEHLAEAASFAVENIELSAEETPRHDISETYKPRPQPDYHRAGTDRRSWWLVAGVILATFLTAQLIHFNRYTLSDSFVGGALRSMYGELSAPSQPEWDINQYDIQRSAAVGSSDNAGTLTIVGRLTNSADFSQPYPVLRLTLLDRWGDQIGVRNLQTTQYLSQAQNAELMNPFEMAGIEVSVVDPEGEPASNFVIEICLPDGRGGLACQ